MSGSPVPTPEIFPLSESAICLTWPGDISPEQHRIILQYRDALLQTRMKGIVQAIPAFRTLTILTDRPVLQFQEQIMTFSGGWKPAPETSPTRKLWEIPVRYGGSFGPDMDELARAKELSATEIIRLHTEPEYYVYLIGFTAGFPYLGGLDARLHHPRRTEPRTKVAAGSVGIGGSQTGVYPVEAPGGWHLIGRTGLRLFDPQKSQPALLQPGDRVRFVQHEVS